MLAVTNMYPTATRPYYGIFVKEFTGALEKLGVEVAVSFTDTSRGRGAYITEVPRLRKTMAKKQHDVIHAHHTYSVWQTKLAQRLSRDKAPVVFTTHEGESLMPEGVRDEKADWLKRIVYLKQPKRWALNAADYVVSVNEHIPKALGYRKPYDVIPPGVDLELFIPRNKSDCRKRLGIPEDETVVLFPADPNNPFKGFDIVKKSLERLTRKTRVITGGDISREDMPIYMNAADVVVQASSVEASPMVAKEAMAVNVPMVSTDAGDVGKIFGSAPGYYICERNPEDLAAKLETALGHKGETRGRDQLQRLGLSLEQVAEKYLSIYKEVLRRSAAT